MALMKVSTSALPLLRLGHVQLAEAKQPKPDELLFHLWLSQPFLCNAGLQFLPLLFQRFQPLPLWSWSGCPSGWRSAYW